MSSNHISFRIKPVFLEAGTTELGKWILRRFQEKVIENLSSKKDTLLVAPTGSGKTLTLLLADDGAVGVYPNNKLLLDQQRSIDNILRSALKSRIVGVKTLDGVDILRIYEPTVKGDDRLPITTKRRVAVVLLSGRYIGYERDDNGRLIPKRGVVLRNIVDKICYTRPGEEPYIITLATPDTALLVMAGLYRNFERAGYAIHDTILAALEGLPIEYMLSKEWVATVGEMGELDQIRQCLLKYPWFIDEFHLYGVYEASALLPILRVFRDYVGWETPVVFSSATPKGTLYERVLSELKLEVINEEPRERGDLETLVRGETDVEVAYVDVGGRGVGKWFRVGDEMQQIVADRIQEIKGVVENGGNAFIVVDRVNQVPPIVDTLLSHKITPECSASIKPPGCSLHEEPVLVGSESISQGINRANVRYGIISGYNWASLIQRFGRIGRKTTSKVVIVAPSLSEGNPLEPLDGRTVAYTEFVKQVKSDWPKVERDLVGTESVRRILETRERLLEISSVVAFAQVSKPRGVYRELAKLIRDGPNPLDKLYGPPESLVNTLLFRRTGFQVIVEKPCQRKLEYKHESCLTPCRELSDIATVLRNYIVTGIDAYPCKLKDGIVKKLVRVKISLIPGRQILVLKPKPTVREDLAERFAGMITTLGELINIGMELAVKPIDTSELEMPIPETVDVLNQTIVLVRTSREVADYLAYTLEGILVHRGERRGLVALFL